MQKTATPSPPVSTPANNIAIHISVAITPKGRLGEETYTCAVASWDRDNNHEPVPLPLLRNLVQNTVTVIDKMINQLESNPLPDVETPAAVATPGAHGEAAPILEAGHATN